MQVAAHPSIMRVISYVDLGPVIGEVGQNDTEVDEASKNASAEAPNRCRCYLRNVDRAYHRGLSDTKPGNEATSVDGSEAAPVPHEDSNTQNPQQAQLSRGPNTPNPITD